MCRFHTSTCAIQDARAKILPVVTPAPAIHVHEIPGFAEVFDAIVVHSMPSDRASLAMWLLRNLPDEVITPHVEDLAAHFSRGERHRLGFNF